MIVLNAESRLCISHLSRLDIVFGIGLTMLLNLKAANPRADRAIACRSAIVSPVAVWQTTEAWPCLSQSLVANWEHPQRTICQPFVKGGLEMVARCAPFLSCASPDELARRVVQQLGRNI